MHIASSPLARCWMAKGLGGGCVIHTAGPARIRCRPPTTREISGRFPLERGVQGPRRFRALLRARVCLRLLSAGHANICKDRDCTAHDIQVLPPFIVVLVAERDDIPVFVRRAVSLNMPANSSSFCAANHTAFVSSLVAEFLPVINPATTAALFLRCPIQVFVFHVSLLFLLRGTAARVPCQFFMPATCVEIPFGHLWIVRVIEAERGPSPCSKRFNGTASSPDKIPLSGKWGAEKNRATARLPNRLPRSFSVIA